MNVVLIRINQTFLTSLVNIVRVCLFSIVVGTIFYNIWKRWAVFLRSRFPYTLSLGRCKWNHLKRILLDGSLCIAVWSGDSDITLNQKILFLNDLFHANHSKTCERFHYSFFGSKKVTNYFGATRFRSFYRFMIQDIHCYDTKLLSQLLSV